MQALVDDLFRFTQAADTLELPLENVDCNQVMNTALENLAVLIAQTGTLVTFDPLPIVSAHASPLVQVFQNLIENGIKYCRPAEHPAIHIRAEPLKSYWRFSVRDNGIGISKDYHRLIFGVFKRLSQQTPGSGIGLAICERVVDRYGGRIWVESEVGTGSTFYFTLPEAARAGAGAAGGARG